MSLISKSLLALDDFIKNVDAAEKERIWLEVKAMNIGGPLVADYFNNLYDFHDISVNFDEGIEVIEEDSPPLQGFKIVTQTPKYSLESFFCYNCLWKMQKQQHFSS